ncbi:MAG: hypothetical protein SVW57_11585, partial [Thermodesulfobacteriota bacterium]|nr:hypothetical protein [Thermodesulfobacteriota bacterium]
MIVRMKKVSIIVKSSSTDKVLNILSKMGIVHLHPCGPTENETIEEIKETILLIQKTLSLIPEEVRGNETTTFTSLEDGITLANQLLGDNEKVTRLKEELQELEKEYDRVQVWGRFDPEEINTLKGIGCTIRLFQCQEKELINIPEDLAFQIISRKDKTLFLAVVSIEDSVNIPLSEVEIPSRGSTEIETLLKEKKEQLFVIQKRLSQAVKNASLLKATKERLEDIFIYEKAREGMGSVENISYLVGFCPESE